MGMISTNKTLDNISALLDRATSGERIETTFDESKVSAIEGKLHRYLQATGVHKHKLQEEKNRIHELISDISHQTKTPLTNILMYTELLSECRNDEERLKYCALLSQQTEKLNFLIASLVKTSRIENGIISPVTKPNEIGLLFKNLSEQFPGIDMQSSDVTAIFDLKWTSEAIGNIIDNAIKYGGTEITLRVTAYSMFCKIDITDNGDGIAEEEIPKIFTRFYRSANVAEKQGVGLGLFLAREIVTKQGGYIKVNSKEGIGSTFSVFLPITT